MCGGGGGGYGLVVFYWGHFSHFEGLLVFWSFRERERERERERDFVSLRLKIFYTPPKKLFFYLVKKKKQISIWPSVYTTLTPKNEENIF